MADTRRPGVPNRIIHDERADPEASLIARDALVAQKRVDTAEKTGVPRVVTDYYPRRPIPSGDPASAEGVLIAESELGPSALQAIADAGDYHEVVLTFPDQVPAGTAINIRTGAYSGGGPAAAEGDAAIITLPMTGADFEGDGRLVVALNGQELNRGSGAGDDEAQWASTTQLRFSMIVFPGNQITVRAPVNPAPIP